MAEAEPGNAGGPAPGEGGRVDPVRVFISYARDDLAHEERVREFWTFLRAHGVDARLDKPAAEQRQDWSLWMLRLREARFVLVVASPAYRKRAEGEAPASEGRGAQWEAALIREEVYADREAALNRHRPDQHHLATRPLHQPTANSLPGAPSGRPIRPCALWKDRCAPALTAAWTPSRWRVCRIGAGQAVGVELAVHGGHDLSPARQAAQRTGEGKNYHHIFFGPTNLGIHMVSVELESGEVSKALRMANEVDISKIAYSERRTAHLHQVARCYECRNNDTVVFVHLKMAAKICPQGFLCTRNARSMVSPRQARQAVLRFRGTGVRRAHRPAELKVPRRCTGICRVSQPGPYPGSGSSVASMTDLMKSSTCGVSNRG